MTGSKCDEKQTANRTTKPYDAVTCAAEGHDPSRCLHKEDMCPAIDWLVPIVLGIYTLVMQVLMLNLVIAMFRYTLPCVFHVVLIS